MEEYPQIIGVGHNCLDHICTVEAYPPEDGSTHITSISIQGGGAVATAMVAASRLGMTAALIGRLGSDVEGKEIVELLKQDQVNTRWITPTEKGRSSVSYVMVNPLTGSRTKFPYPDDLPPIVWDDELKTVIKNAKVLHLDGTKYDNGYAAASIAREVGTPISLDGCSMQKDNKKNRALASMADILIMNAKYPLRVAEMSDHTEALKEIASWGPKIVITTMGVDGCLAMIDGKVEHFPAYSVESIDTTGAGDVFHGAFVTGWLRGMELKQNIRFAAAVAALKCRKIGGRAGIPDIDTVLSFLNANEGSNSGS